MPDLRGKTLGKYRLIELLGRGGMAEVYKAHQPFLDRFVAIKVLHTFLADDQDFRGRFQREAQSIANFRHPNIVQVYDFDQSDDLFYIVMEFIDGRNLKTVLTEHHEQGKNLPLDQALQITNQVGGALSYAHERGVVHRDVKPANIMLHNSGHIFLTDFGVAKIMGGTQHTASGMMLGTPAYMAPEQGLGEAGDARADIYSLGVTLYEMLTGRVPFDADTPLGVALKHLNEPLPTPRSINPQISTEIERVLLTALVKEPDHRYASVDHFLNDLAYAAQAEPAIHPPPVAAREFDIPSEESIQPSTPAGVDQAARPALWTILGIGLALLTCLGLVVVASLVAFPGAEEPTQGISALPVITPTSPPGLGPPALFDDFSNPNSGWERSSSNGGMNDYSLGRYRMRVESANAFRLALAGVRYSDLRLEVAMHKIGGPLNDAYGIACRVQDPQNFYFLLLSSDGFFGIGKYEDGVSSLIDMSSLRPSAIIQQDGASNHLRADCVGRTLSLYANQEMLISVTDDSFQAGDVGLLTRSFDQAGIEVEFDDFTLWDLAEPVTE